MECSANGFIDRSDTRSISDPGVLQNFVKVELMVATEAKKSGKETFAKEAACFLPSSAYGARL